MRYIYQSDYSSHCTLYFSDNPLSSWSLQNMLNRSEVTGVGLNKETNEESSKNAFPTILINHEDTSITPAGP